MDSLVSAIRVVSAGDAGLSEASLKALGELRGPADVEVVVTLQCGFCPEAVAMAHRLAAASEHVTASMVELSAFPEYAQSRGVRAVPKVMVNGEACFEGRRSEEDFVRAVVACAAEAAAAEPVQRAD